MSNNGNGKDEMSFNEYLEMVKKNPKLAALSHERIYNMIMHFGKDEEGRYNLFKGELFGLEEQIKAVVDYFKSGARRLDTRKRILLLHGPVSSAKSSLVELMKEGLEEYCKTDEGAMYAIIGCPMHEEPLHLIPQKERQALMDENGLYIEGDLCPHCRHNLEHKYDGDYTKFQVERIYISEQGRLGIGTFLPSDPKSQDISELVGSINFNKIAEYGVESHPFAYVFDGELNISNRGVMEFIEMLKADEKFLYVLLILTQEQVIKAPRFPRIYCDVVILAHTNEAEYNEFIGDPRSEALQDRIIKIDFPYNLKVSEEVKIYEKLLRNAVGTKHISPDSLRVASMLAVISRLEEMEGDKINLIKKMQLYDGLEMEHFSQSDVEALKEMAKREGMDGISPRYVVNTISNALIQDEIECLTPIELLRALRDGLKKHPQFNEKDIERYKDLIALVTAEYTRLAEDVVKEAIIGDLQEEADELFEIYISNVDAYVNKKDIVDEDEKEIPVDEALMNAIESRMRIPENSHDSYRQQILAKMGSWAVKGEKFDFKSEDPLKKAIYEMIYEQHRHKIQAITTVKRPQNGLEKKIGAILERLREKGYCEYCAKELLQYIGAVYNMEDNLAAQMVEEQEQS
jgi:serine protein kinase